MEVIDSPNYGDYSVFSLLCVLWDVWEEIHALDALISIDFLHTYEAQRRNCYDGMYEIRNVLRESLLPPQLTLLIRYQNMKIVYNPKVHDRQSYLKFLLRKKNTLERHQRIIDRHDQIRSNRRRRNVVVVNATRGCLRQ